MFGISFGEILLILIIALIVLGPQKLPIIMGRVGRLIYTTRDYFIQLKTQVYNQTGLAEFEQTKLELINSINKLKYDLSKNMQSDHIVNDILIFNDEILYQPELDFDREPELFDDLPDEFILNESIN